MTFNLATLCLLRLSTSTLLQSSAASVFSLSIKYLRRAASDLALETVARPTLSDLCSYRAVGWCHALSPRCERSHKRQEGVFVEGVQDLQNLVARLTFDCTVQTLHTYARKWRRHHACTHNACSSGIAELAVGDALIHSEDMLNMCPTASLSETPHEALFEIVPDVSWQRMWGCYMHLHSDPRQLKERRRSRDYMTSLLGCSKKIRGDKFLHLKTGVISTSRGKNTSCPRSTPSMGLCRHVAAQHVPIRR